MPDEPAFPRKVAAAFYFFLILLGILFYVAWGLLFDTWDLTKPANSGVYALTAILLGFGITGFLLYRTPARRPEQDQ